MRLLADLPADAMRDAVDLALAFVVAIAGTLQIVLVVRGDDGPLVWSSRFLFLVVYPAFVAACSRLATGVAA